MAGFARWWSLLRCWWGGHVPADFAWPEDAFARPGALVEVPTARLISYRHDPRTPWAPPVMVLGHRYCARCLAVWQPSGEWAR
jgi:hypothetical protein